MLFGQYPSPRSVILMKTVNLMNGADLGDSKGLGNHYQSCNDF